MKAQRVEKVLTLNQPLCGSRGESSESEPPAALRGWTKMDGEQKETLSCSEGRTGKGTACSPLTSTGTRRNRRWVREAGARRGAAVAKSRARTPGEPSRQPRRLRCPPRAPQDPRTFRAEAAAQPEGTTDRPAPPDPQRPWAASGGRARGCARGTGCGTGVRGWQGGWDGSRSSLGACNAATAHSAQPAEPTVHSFGIIDALRLERPPR